MLKVLLIAPTFGIAKDNKTQAMMSAYKTALYLSEKAHVIVLAAGPEPQYEKVHDQLEVYRLKNIYLKDPINYVITPSIFWHTVRLIRKENPDIFLVNKFMFFNAFVIPLLKLMGKRVYTQIDAFPSIDWISRTPWIRPIMWMYLRFIAMPLLWLSDGVILFHEGMVPIAKKFRIKYHVIHNGVNMDEFQNVSIASELQKKSPDEIHIGYIGRLESMKGYDILLEACKKLLPSYPNVKLFMVGSTVGKESILRKYSHPQITFLGMRNDVPSLLQGMDIFILPSFSEGLSNSLMEAMASGCAVIATDTLGGNRVLVEDGVTGLLTQPGDVIDLAKKIRYLIEHPEVRTVLGKNARKLIQEKFNWKNIAEEYLRLFNEKLEK